MTITINWHFINEGKTDLWQLTRCLYCYIGPEDELLYFGKVAGQYSSVRRRWTRSGKSGFWDFIESELGIFEHSTAVGLLELPIGNRYSTRLLADIETLLIYHRKPPGNVDCTKSRISRPSMSVRCKGDWPYPKRLFVDS